MSRFIDLKGKKFNRLLVIEKKPEKHYGEFQWLCQCDCGNTVVVSGANLRTNHTKSCGCLQVEMAKKSNTKHGYRTRGRYNSEYFTWNGLRQRCNNPNTPKYKFYGGRGISVCERWENSFENFIEDMGEKPLPKKLYSIERVDNEGNYEPSNCIWATYKQQNNNRRILGNVPNSEMIKDIQQGMNHKEFKSKYGYSSSYKLILLKKELGLPIQQTKKIEITNEMLVDAKSGISYSDWVEKYKCSDFILKKIRKKIRKGDK